jgi:uncharacterized protein with FMN-binding domain
LFTLSSGPGGPTIMKYKQIIIILLFTTILLITACSYLSGKKETEEITPVPLKRTTYIGYSDTSDHGYAMAIITLEDDRMTHVVLKEFTELSVEKDFSVYEYAPSVQAQAVLPHSFIKAQSIDVEGISGATASFDRYRQAVKRAMESAKTQKGQNKYFDGIFQGRSKADNHGYGIALVEIKDDRITGVKLKEVDEKGELKDFEIYPHEPSKEAHAQLPQWFVESNSPDIDNFTGATHSTDKYKEAVENALRKAIIERNLPDLIDGTYTAVSDTDSQGYSGATITIENNMITEVKLKEYNEVSLEKDFASYEYEPSVNANMELPWAFVAAQSFDVDVVTGATHSSEHYIQAVQRALVKASWAEKDGEYFDGVFQAPSEIDDHGYCIAVVTIKDDQITDVVLKDIDAKGQEKNFEKYDYEPSQKAFRELPERFVRANSYQVDIVTGATHSSMKYREAVKKALESAKKR